MGKKVKVLLSSYNGEEYIGQQLDSILQQTYPDIEIYVRDDGSKDHTVELLEVYEKKGLIHLEKGSNVGFVQSFFWLVANSGEADYYAFSDQDDVWFPEKIAMALEKLSGADETKPVLYFSNYDFYDGDLHFLAHRDSKSPKISFRNSLVDCVSLGFNSVFNRTARELTVTHMPVKSTGHDWWMYMLCSGLGEVIYDERPTVKYRRHNANVSDGGDSFLKFQIWRFKRFFLNGYFKKIHEQIKEFEVFFGDRLSEEDRKELALFTKDGFHPGNTFKKVFYPKYFRQRPIDEIFIRLVILIGRL
jgi:glycosyltransferase involved in cell wall biosynthesis